LNEAEQVMATFAQNLGVKVIHVDAAIASWMRSLGVRPGTETQNHRP